MCNPAFETLFGYQQSEILGADLDSLLAPHGSMKEAAALTRRSNAGHVVREKAKRLRSDGSLVDVQILGVPISADGKLIGSFGMYEDITERRRAQAQQNLLLREMNHRVKNLFALSSSVVSLSALSAETPDELASAVCERLRALARAHTLTLAKPSDGGNQTEPSTTLHALVRAITAPYADCSGGRRIAVTGADVPITGRAMALFALLLHEFATNAAKYGALSTPSGCIAVACSEQSEEFTLVWTERGGPAILEQPTSEGFGSLLARATVKSNFGGELARDWRPEGLVIRLAVRRDRLSM